MGKLDELTEREQEILKLLAQGLQNKEIGCKLYIAQHTVEQHIRNIYKKLGLKNRVAAAAHFWREWGDSQ